MAGLNLGPAYGAGGMAEGLQRILENQFRERQIALMEKRAAAEEARQAELMRREAEQEAIRRDALRQQAFAGNVSALSGMRSADIPVEMAEGGTPGTLPSQPQGLARLPGVQATNRFKAMPSPGMPSLGVAGVPVRPETAEDQQDQARRAAVLKLQTTLHNVPEGGEAYLGDQLIAKNPRIQTPQYRTVGRDLVEIPAGGGPPRVAFRGRSDETAVPTLPVGIGASGPEALAKLDPATRATVQSIIDYRYPMPTGGFAMRDPQWKAIIGAAQAADPTFDVTQYGSRSQLRQAFGSGKEAQNVKALNTAVEHLSRLAKSGQELGNVSFTPANTAKNWIVERMGWETPAKFEMDRDAVAGELAAIFKATGATDPEIAMWRQRINSSMSPAQLKATTDEAIGLMGGRLAALRSQWETGMGKPADFRLLSDKSRTLLQNMGADVEQIDPSGAAAVMPTDTGPAVTKIGRFLVEVR